MLPDKTTERELLATADLERHRIVEAMAVRCAVGGTDTSALSTSAGAELETYARDLLRALTHAVSGAWDKQTISWIADRYDECLAKLATALRDLIDESGLRHDVAQALQRKMLEAELCLGAALDAHDGTVGA